MPKQNNLYFIALIPRRELREKINVFKNDFDNRFNSRKALRVYPHITLKAPFMLTRSAHSELMRWFKDLYIRQEPYVVQLKSFGAFKNAQNPVVFIQPEQSKELSFMQKELIASFSSVFPGDIHTVDVHFKPHVTVAYRDLSPEMFKKAWSEYEQKSFYAEFEVDALYMLQHDTKKWNIIDTYNLPQNVEVIG